MYKIPKSPNLSDTLAPVDLTQREIEIVMLLYTGYTQNEIADKLYLTRNTVKNHIANSCNKIGVHSTIQLLQWYVDSVLMDYCNQNFESLAEAK